ncbi:MAG: NPCBM/NEW2 domain-containing protein [Blastocatellia bacterium]|nr:NPCBM/NEW2 domain-containing protein [Blastocatellia bacterium]
MIPYLSIHRQLPQLLTLLFLGVILSTFSLPRAEAQTLRDIRKPPKPTPATEQSATLRTVREQRVTYLNDLEPKGQTLAQSRTVRQLRQSTGSITLKGISYQKGLRAAASSDLTYALEGQYTYFRASLGIADEARGKGSVVFQVYADGVRIFDSGKVTGEAWTKQVSLNVAGRNELRLVVTDAGDGAAFDLAVWAEARLERTTGLTTRTALPSHQHSTGPDDPDHVFNDYLLAARAKSYPAFVPPTNTYQLEAGENLSGKWDAKVTWPFVIASAANLPDGRILAWGGNNPTSFSGGSNTYAAIWDPKTNQISSANHSTHSMFCGIPTMLEDGRVFVNGGDGTRERVSAFDFRTNQWTRLENMNRGRWYPGSVALPNGKVFTALGEPGDIYPEIWTPGQGWSLLTGANLQAPILNFPGYQKNWLPYLYLAPSGLIFHNGPTQQMNWINFSGNGSVSNAGIINTWYPKYSAAVMYDQGKILVTGGQVNGDVQAATNQAMIIDLNGATPTKTAITSMANARKFHNAVVLPTGEVLIVGGNTSGIEFSDQGTILTPEIWNPETQTWRTVAAHSVPRNYHSVALLMPDGRVWSGGGGLCGCAADHPDHQIFNPPYLYNADGSLAQRPAINTAPASTRAGQTLAVQASAGITKFSLIKMAGLTHNLNSDLRHLRIPFTTTAAGDYQLTLPSNINVLTPGYWMLFALNNQGTPSIAKVIQVTTQASPTITNPGAKTNYVGDTVNLPITAGDPNGDGLTFSASGLPAGLAINSTTGVITGTLTTTGNYSVTISANDGNASATTNFDWQVTTRGAIRYVKLEALSEVNGNAWASAAEVNILDGNGNVLNRTGWTATTNSEETQGEDGRAINAIDGNVNTIWHTQWSSATPSHPHWIVLDMKANYTVGGFRYLPRQTGAINGTIADYKFYVSADGINWGQAVAQGRFDNTRTEKSGNIQPNRDPILPTLTSRTNAVSESMNVSVTASDPDGDALAFAATGLPPGLTISNTGAITGSLTTAGNYNVVILVSDPRGGSTSGSFLWSVTPPAMSINALTSTPKPANTAISYTASVNNAVNPRFKWLFGDGSAETAYSTSPTTSHAFAQPGIYVVKVTATDDRGIEKSTTFTQAIHLPATVNRPTVSMNIAYETRATGNARLWVVNQDNDTVSVFDAVTNAKLAEIAVGSAPRSVAIAPNGRIWVTNKRTASISLIDPSTLAIVQTIPLPYASQPFGIAFAPTGGSAYVALEAAGKLYKLDASTGALTGSAEVGQNVRHLSISANGTTVYLSRFISPRVPGEETAAPQVNNGGGEVLVITASTMSVTQTIRLQHSDKFDTENAGRGIPNYLGPAVISPDGITAWVPSKQDNLLRGSLRDGRNLTFDSTVRSITSAINLTSNTEDYAARIDHNNGGIASTGIFDRTGNYLFVALEGSREIAVLDVYGKRELFRLNVGRAPQGLTLSPDGAKLFVSNFMDRTVSVLDVTRVINEGANTAPTLATLNSVATEKLAAQVLRGKQFFYDAQDTRLARDAYISCASCHNDGGQDGRIWDLTGFGEGLRNTISLQGRLGAQGFLHWSANFDEVQDFEGQIRNLAGGTGLMTDAQFNTGTRNQSLGDRKTGISADLDALAAYVVSLNNFSPSPYRNANGSMTADAIAGKEIFRTANCAQCHSGTAFTEAGTGVLRNIGTLKSSSGSRLGAALPGIDTPTLRDVWFTAPYLHDGSAATLEAAIRAHNGVTLNDGDLAKLVAYLNQIGSEEATAPTTNVSPSITLTAPTNNAAFAAPAAITLTANAADSDGSIARVEFYQGATKLGEDTTTPYSFAWNNVTAGSYTLTALAFDNLGAATNSTAATITVTQGGGLLGEYYDNINFTGTRIIRTDATVNFNWGTGAPMPGIAADTFSVRWIGQIQAKATETYTFYTNSDDGIRLWVNRRLVINNWTDHSPVENSGTIALQAGQRYDIVLEYYENGGGSIAQLSWSSPSQSKQIIPPTNLFPGKSVSATAVNVAQGRSATQSSTYSGAAASRAVDGNTNGAFRSNSVTHTNSNANAWWQVDLGSNRAIESIRLYNRTDCCGERLSNFYVFVSSTNMSGRSYSSLLGDSSITRYQVTGSASSLLTIPAIATGRYVRVQLAGTNYLSLAEVQVLGQ